MQHVMGVAQTVAIDIHVWVAIVSVNSGPRIFVDEPLRGQAFRLHEIEIGAPKAVIGQGA